MIGRAYIVHLAGCCRVEEELMAVVNRLIGLLVTLSMAAAVVIYLISHFDPPLPKFTHALGERNEAAKSLLSITALGKHTLANSTSLILNVSSTSDNTTLKNPGCTSKRLGSYKPVSTGIVYNHPPIVHYAKLTRGSSTASLTFMDYMAMMSAYKFIRPDKIIIHTYTDIRGKYWELARKWNTSVQVNRVKRVTRLGGKGVFQMAHQADYIKLCGLLEFGGVTSDFDVIVVNGTKLKSMQRLSECVLSREGEYTNAGFTSCIRDSPFIQRWLDGYRKDYRPDLWLHNASFKPAGFLQDKKSDICYNMYVVDGIATQPTYSHAGDFWKKRNGVDWREKVAAHYFDKSIRSFSERALDRIDSIGELLRHVRDA